MIWRPPRSTRTYTLFPYTTALPIWGADHDLDVVFRGETDGADQPTHIVGAFGRLHPAPREFADPHDVGAVRLHQPQRSEEHTSALQSLMRISYAVFCSQTKYTHNTQPQTPYTMY